MNFFPRAMLAACKCLAKPESYRLSAKALTSQAKAISTVTTPQHTQALKNPMNTVERYSILSRLLDNAGVMTQQCRTRVYQSWKKGKPETVREVPSRFKRLSNGLWIRPRAGRHRALWKRSPETLENLRQHVICSKRQSWMLERMVGKFWKRHHHYPNDPYAPYHIRNGLKTDTIYKPNKAPFYP